jgi:hypothetical protein
MNAAQILDGRREGQLLAFPSVRRMADILSQRCREQSWVRTSIATLERFRIMTGNHDLEALLKQAIAEPAVAEHALASFAAALAGYTESQVSALAMGPKIWFRLNGVAIAWRPLPGTSVPFSLGSTKRQGIDDVILLALIGSGLRLAELLRLRRGDVGSLDGEGGLIPDIEADPMAVQYTPHVGKRRERITFLTYQARQALLAFFEQSTLLDLDTPLIANHDGSPISSADVARARRRSRALIRAGNDVNVELCRATGNFFRDWGLPGSRFTGPEDLNVEEYI